MTIVDTSVWADFFNGIQNPHVERLDSILSGEEDLAIVPIILMEVLQGFRTEAGFRRARAVLTALPVIHPGVDCHVRAARLFRTLRRRGITVRGSVDCLIAQTCIDAGAELLSLDVDFERIARHVPLLLWRA